MEMLLVYLSVLALLAAVAGLFKPRLLAFWCAPEDRSRAMAFTVYFSAAVVLAVVFIVVVPEPKPDPMAAAMPDEENVVETAPPVHLTRPIFLRETLAILNAQPTFAMETMDFSLLDFGVNGATAHLKFSQKPHRKVAVAHATSVVKAMTQVYRKWGWKISDAMLIECQVHTDEIIYTGEKGHRSMGFARLHPSTGKISWLDFAG